MKKEINNQTSDKNLVPAIAQAARVLLVLAESDSSHMRVSEICSRAGIHSSRAYSILYTLQQFGFTQKNIGGRGHSLGPKLIALSRKFLDNLNVPALAKPFLENLAKASSSTAALALIVNDQLTIVAKQEGDGNELGITVRVGRNFHLTHSAEGKAIAAFLSENELEALLQRKDIFFQNKSGKLDKNRLLHDLEECRRLGYALDHGEVNPRFNAVASPIFGPAGAPMGCLTVIGIPFFERAQQIGPKVANAAQALSLLIGANTR